MIKNDIFQQAKDSANTKTAQVLSVATKINYYNNGANGKSSYIILLAKCNETILKLFPELHNTQQFDPKKDAISFKGTCYTEVFVGDEFIATGLSLSKDKYGYCITADSIMPKHVQLSLEEAGDMEGLARFIGSLGAYGIKVVRARQILAKYAYQSKKDDAEVVKFLTNLVKMNDEAAFHEAFKKVIKIERTLSELWKNWREQQMVQAVKMQLAKYNLTDYEIHVIVKQFGENAIPVIEENPYRLITIARVGFKRADRIAELVGLSKTDTKRMFGGICAYYADKTNMSGDTLLDANDTFAELCEFMGYEKNEEKRLFKQQFKKWLNESAAMKLFPIPMQSEIHNCFTLSSDFEVEQAIMKNLLMLKSNGMKLSDKQISDCQQFIDNDEVLKNGARIQLDPSQKEAIKTVLHSPVSALTGGAGCGKTTILKRLVLCALRSKMTIALCSPTGKAAKRMTESIGIEGLTATTIHSLFKLKGDNSQAKIASGEASATLESGSTDVKLIDWLFIDESSMIDMYMANAILKNVRPDTRITFIGDPQQLPSVGKGCFFFDFIESGQFPIARLTKTHRQADGNDINDVAHAVLTNNPSALKLTTRQNVSYRNYDYLEKEGVLQHDVNSRIANDLVNHYIRLVRTYGIENVQVLTPSRQSQQPLSSNSLNFALRYALHNRREEGFALNDRVMGIKNNPAFRNGEVGTVVHVSDESLLVRFDGEAQARDCKEYEKWLTFGYAITVHKSQGSEYKHVLIPLSRSDIFMLNRNWLYTAITRGKEFVHLFGQNMPISMAVRKQSTRRNTLLRHLLNGIKPTQTAIVQSPKVKQTEMALAVNPNIVMKSTTNKTGPKSTQNILNNFKFT